MHHCNRDAQRLKRLFVHLSGIEGLVLQLLYGTGMRLIEGVRLRIKDVDFERAELLIRSGKGDKDRVTMLPHKLIAPMRTQRRENHADLYACFESWWSGCAQPSGCLTTVWNPCTDCVGTSAIKPYIFGTAE